MSNIDQRTPPFKSPYQNAMKPASLLQHSTYPSPARSDSEISKYPVANGLGVVYDYLHSFATSGPSVTAGLYPPSPQPTESWAQLSPTGASPLLHETTTGLWQSNYDHQAPRSPPSWDPNAETHRSSVSSSTRDLAMFSREGSELPYTHPQIKLEGGAEWASEGKPSPPMSHPVPMTVSPEHLSTAAYPYEHSYGSPSFPKLESTPESYEDNDVESISYDRQSHSPRLRGQFMASTGRRTRRQVTSAANAKFFCDQCPKFFQRSFNLNQHILTHDPSRPKDYKCEYANCDKQFVRPADLHRHENSVHLKRKPFRCSKCDARFARKDTLRRHEDDGCPKRTEVNGRQAQQLFGPMRTGATPSMTYYPSPRPDVYDARSPSLFRDDSFSRTPSGY